MNHKTIKGIIFFALLLTLTLQTEATTSYTINCSRSDTKIEFGCTFVGNSTWTGSEILYKNVGGTLTFVCLGGAYWNPSASTCNNTHTTTYNSSSCSLQPSTNYSIRLYAYSPCNDYSNEVQVYGNISTYQCYPGDSVPAGYTCSNNLIVPLNYTATQILWQVAPTSIALGDSTNFQIKYQTLGQVGISNGSCNFTIVELGQTYAMYNTSLAGVYTINTLWTTSGTYHYYATCNATNITSSAYLLTNSSTNQFFVTSPLVTTPTTLSGVTLPTYSNASIINGSLSPASNWTCSNMAYLLLSGNLVEGAMCPFTYSFGPVWFFGLMLFIIVALAYIKTRMWEAPAILTFLWTGAFATFLPYTFGQIIIIGGAVGFACIGLSIFNRESTS
jgi:hypothetical protein